LKKNWKQFVLGDAFYIYLCSKASPPFEENE